MKKDPLSKCKTTPSSSYFAISVKIVGSSKSACPCVRISWKRIHVHLHWRPHVARSWFLIREPGATKVIRTRACHIRPWAPGTNTSNHMSRDALKFNVNVSSWPLTHLKFWKIMIALHKSQPQINLPCQVSKTGWFKIIPHIEDSQTFNSGISAFRLQVVDSCGMCTFPLEQNIIITLRCETLSRMPGCPPGFLHFV